MTPKWHQSGKDLIDEDEHLSHPIFLPKRQSLIFGDHDSLQSNIEQPLMTDLPCC